MEDTSLLGKEPSEAKGKSRSFKFYLLMSISLGLLVTYSFIQYSKYVNTFQVEGLKQGSNLDRALKIMSETPLIDGHNDLPYHMNKYFNNDLTKFNLEEHVPEFMTDIPRIRQGKLGAQFWSIYVKCYNDGNENHDYILRTMEQIDVTLRFIEKYNETFELATSSSDIVKSFKDGKLASLMGIEGGHSIQNSLPALRLFYNLGVRYLTLTHTCHVDWADTCSKPPIHNGLTKFGESVILEMNRLGMLVDLSHVSADVMRQVLRISKSPVIFSHSSAFSVCHHPRNVPDDVLQMVKERNSIVMINFYPGFVTGSDKATIEDVVKHILYVVNLIGSEHVGIGSDFDGIEVVPEGLEDVSKYPHLIARLLDEGLTETQIKGILGENLIRVFSSVEEIAHQLRQTMEPVDERINREA